MKLLCNLFLAVAMLVAFSAPPALADNGAAPAIYTWVDADGIRHYADHPGSPNARRVSSLDVPVPAALEPEPAAGDKAGAKARPTPSAATTASRAERAARCGKLRAEVERLQPARRVKVEKNGGTRYLSGADLVAFEKTLTQRMRSACAPPPGNAAGNR